jgi:hypothetical protein
VIRVDDAQGLDQPYRLSGANAKMRVPGASVAPANALVQPVLGGDGRQLDAAVRLQLVQQ